MNKFIKYEFENDGTFKFISEGYYANAEYSGAYIVSDSLIFLAPDTEWPVLDGVLKMRLKIMNTSCIRDFDNNYYCTGIDSINSHIEGKYVFQEKSVQVINSLKLVKDEKYRLLQNCPADSCDFEIAYNGIVVVAKQEYHSFSLDQWYLFDSRRYLTFFIRERPFEIYQHRTYGDKLIKIEHPY